MLKARIGAEGRRAMLAAYCRMILIDYHEWFVATQRHVAYLGRYAPGLGVNSCGMPVEQWPMSYLHAHVQMITNIVSRENDAGKPKKSFGPPR